MQRKSKKEGTKKRKKIWKEDRERGREERKRETRAEKGKCNKGQREGMKERKIM